MPSRSPRLVAALVLALAGAAPALPSTAVVAATTPCAVHDVDLGMHIDDLAIAVGLADPKDRLVVRGVCHGPVTIDRPLTIRGAGAAVIKGDGIDPAVTIAAGIGVTIRGLRVTGGAGGGIVNHGRLLLVRTTVEGNTATGDGGGIANDGALTLRSSTVADNTATGDGGGIANTGTLVISGASRIRDNLAGIAGGGIANTGTLTADGAARIERNRAGGDGGGIHNDGAAVLGGSVRVRRNTAGGDGGGVADSAVGRLTMRGGARVERNTATASGGGLWDAGASEGVRCGMPGANVRDNTPDDCAP